jgi:predicted Zn-dependent protease
MDALKDLQSARDGFLRVRKAFPWYLWVERDLVFVYQSLGAFFLDIGLQQARRHAVAHGVTPDRIEGETRRIYLSKEFDSWEKRESKSNYDVALQFTESFVRLHQKLEQDRINRRDSADYEDELANPFQVDLVMRFRSTMDELIVEDRDIRVTMILEASALCIEPLFQVNDVRKAEAWATRLQASKPNDPIHHFVRATAYFNVGQYEDAVDSYNAYLKESSPTQDSNRRNLARDRKRQCQFEISRVGNAGEDSGR